MKDKTVMVMRDKVGMGRNVQVFLLWSLSPKKKIFEIDNAATKREGNDGREKE